MKLEFNMLPGKEYYYRMDIYKFLQSDDKVGLHLTEKFDQT